MFDIVKNFFLKIDAKSYIIIFLVIISLFFIYRNYINDGNSELIKKLEKEQNSLIEDRKVIKHELDSIKMENIDLLNQKLSLLKKVDIDKKELEVYKSRLGKSEYNLDLYKIKYNNYIFVLDSIRINPVIRNNDELLVSLKKHIEKNKN